MKVFVVNLLPGIVESIGCQSWTLATQSALSPQVKKKNSEDGVFTCRCGEEVHVRKMLPTFFTQLNIFSVCDIFVGV